MTQHPSIEDTVRILKTNSVLYKKALDGLASEELHRRPSDHSNPMIWLAGHILYSRCGLVRYTGRQAEMPWPALFKRHSQVQPKSAYPSLDDILAGWDANNKQLKQRLAELTPEQLSGPGPYDLPIQAETLASGISFLTWHESYHVGQMGYLRKWLGHEGLVG